VIYWLPAGKLRSAVRFPKMSGRQEEMWLLKGKWAEMSLLRAVM